MTESKLLEQTAHGQHADAARFRKLYDDTPSMVLSLDAAARVLSVNRFGASRLGYDEAELIGRAFTELHPDRVQLDQELARCAQAPGQICRWETRLRCRDSVLSWVRVNARQIEDEHGAPMTVLACDDISEQKRLSAEVQFHATHDALTGLVNRREIESLLARTIDNARQRGGHHALCFIDLDNFKVVNDTYGHHAGDELLRQLADQMQAATRQRDVLARLGGDEFALLLEHCGMADAERIARNLIAAITGHEFLWQDYRLHVGCCIGVAPIGAQVATINDVLRAADAACFAAKELGPGTLHLYAEDDSLVMRRRVEMNWANRLRRALHDDRIEVFAQPIAALADGRIRGFETLARVRDSNDDLLGPDRFIGAALRYGLLREIDITALRKTLAFLETHAGELRDFDWIAVNIAGASLTHPGFVDAALDAIRAADVDPAILCFEITENSVISNLSQAQRFIAEFQEMGCKFALDDFGMGLSSFHYLRVFPVDYIKIDGSFIRDVLNDRADRAMVEAINQIAHLMGKTTVAEYVEDETLCRAVQELGIDYGQGFHYGCALPLEQALLRKETIAPTVEN